MTLRVLLAIGLNALPLILFAETLAFVNVNVVPMTEEVVWRGRTVIVEDDRIALIGPVDDTVLPDDAVVVDGTDRYLIPGLAEMHGRISDTSEPELDRLFALYLANGITTVRGMAGRPAHLELRDRLAAGERLGPRLVTAGPTMDGESINGVDEAVRTVIAQKIAGYDFLAVGSGLTRAEFLALAAEAGNQGIPFSGEVPPEVGLASALDAGIASIEHLDAYLGALAPESSSRSDEGVLAMARTASAGESAIAELVAATVAAGAWNVPAQALFEHTVNAESPERIADWPEMRYVSPATSEEWIGFKTELLADPGFDRPVADRAIELRRQLVAALQEAGAGLLLGSDSPQRFNVPGFALHRELELLVAAGLSPFQALQTGTVNPARFFADADERGTIAVGQQADLVLLDDNPLADISNTARVHGTLVRGRWLARAELDQWLESAERR